MIPEGYLLRPADVADATALTRCLGRNRDHLGPWEADHDASYYTVDGQRASLERQQAAAADGSGESWLLFSADGEVVGGVNLHQIVRLHIQSTVLGYWVDREHTRRGLARAMVDHAVERGRRLGLHRLEAGTHVDNAASQAALRAAGFEEIGVARGLLHLRGRWADHLLFQRILGDGPPPAG